jgi:hypothetical protein
MGSFKVGIDMAGAISAGAYTAGVLDFLIEALDEWYAAKERGDAVPMHDLSLDVFSGASAGGMCAAIAALQVQENFEHIHDTSRQGTTNRFYESWVNKIDIRELLQTRDLSSGHPVVSLLDSTIIETIAQFALTPGSPKPRKYVSPSLTLFMSLTNLRGVPYSLNGAAPGSAEETTSYYADRIRFETVKPGAATRTPLAKPLPLGQPDQGAWSLLRTAAMATGAFPVFLAPRQLTRDVSDYRPPMWESVSLSAGSGLPANFPSAMPTTWSTINVDGGVTNNDPFNFAHDYLATLSPPSPNNQNPRDPSAADRAVVTVAPFPTEGTFDPDFSFAKSAGLSPAIKSLFSALISQSRFFGESLALIMTGTTFSRFVVAPSDTSLPSGIRALQCASLGAFGGFFERSFRAHDYQLGRRNCQQFLRCHFALPVQNPIIDAGLGALGARRDAVIANFKVPPPTTEFALQYPTWIPLIPLCSDSVRQDVPAPARAKIAESDLDTIVDLIDHRFKAVVPLMLDGIPSTPLRLFLDVVEHVIAFFGKRPLKNYLKRQLGSSISH